MSLPKWIPGWVRPMIVTSRPANDSDNADDLLERDFQHEARVQKLLSTDKVCAVKSNKEQIKRMQSFIKQAKGKAKEEFEQRLERLYAERFELLKNEILNSVKDSAGLIDYGKLSKIPGSPEYCRRKVKEKQNPKQELRERETNGCKDQDQNRGGASNAN